MKKLKYIGTILMSALIFTGCSAENLMSNEMKNELENEFSTIEIEQNKDELINSLTDNNVSITEKKDTSKDKNEITLDNITKEILLTMSLEDLKIFVEKYLPGYRETYHIDADKVLTDEDWESLRHLIALSLFNNDSLDSEEAKEITLEESKINTDKEYIENDKNSKYYAPDLNEIESMSLKAFAEYLNEMSIYYKGENESIDFTQLDNESLQELKDEYIESLKNNKIYNELKNEK